MTDDPQDDLDQARMWLQMDPREHANRVAELAKRQRKAALLYGDACAGHTEPVTFVAVDCISCGIGLTRQNHAIHRICIRCKEESDAILSAARSARDRHQRKLAAGTAGAWTILAAIVTAIAVAAGGGWAIGAVAYWVGGLWS